MQGLQHETKGHEFAKVGLGQGGEDCLGYTALAIKRYTG